MLSELYPNRFVFVYLFSVYYIHRFFRGSGYSPQQALVPCLPVFVTFVAVAVVMIASEVSATLQAL